MAEKEKKNLEEIARTVRRGIKLPELEPWAEFEAKNKKIARRYGGEEAIQQEGSHRFIRVGNKRVGWSPRQKGAESVVSSGVFQRALEDVSVVTGITYDQLELYFKGSGKPYKLFRRRFEEEYDL